MISPETLRRYPYFAHVGEESLKQVAMISDEKFIPAGTVIFREGDEATYLNVIVEGEVDIQYELGSGEKRTVDTLVSGDILGWSALIEPFKATAVATATKDTRLVRIEARKLRELCEKDTMLGYRLALQIAKLLANRLESARVQLAAV